MDPTFEYRNSSRVNHEATAMIETRDNGDLHYGTMYNFSGDGMYCGSDFALKVGTTITIRLESRSFNSVPKISLGEIRRCEELADDDNSHLYGLSIQITKAIYR
jgi:hypothetical protein